MALSPSQQEQQKSLPKAMASVPQLLTPEEPFADNFIAQVAACAAVTITPAAQIAGPSPPASPACNSFSTESRFQQTDRILFPENGQNDRSDAERPLFSGTYQWTTPDQLRAISRAITPPAPSGPTPTSQHSTPSPTVDASPTPGRSEQRRLRPEDIVGPVALYKHYGVAYYEMCMRQNLEFKERQRMAQRTLPLPTSSRRAERDIYTERVKSQLRSSPRVEKPAPTRAGSKKPKSPRVAASKAPTRIEASPATPKHDSQTKRSRRRTSTPADHALGAYSNVAQPKARTRAAPSKKIDDKGASDWRQIPDYCPAHSSLDSMSQKLVVQWTNANELNLDDDPDRDQLHAQELKVASTLRLKCNQYLANKRRIFQARFIALQEGKDFNKTSAQTSTNIDVNKASRLWAAFDHVGWFDEHWYAQHL